MEQLPWNTGEVAIGFKDDKKGYAGKSLTHI